VSDRVIVLNDPVNFIDPDGRLIATATLIGYVWGPTIIAGVTAAAYRLAPYTPVIADFTQGLIMPGPFPPNPAGAAGWATREYIIDAFINRKKQKDNPCP
jgi:hypothetical protein